MAVNKLKYKNPLKGTIWNETEGAFIGYRINVLINKKRYRNRRFPSQAEAEKHIEYLKRGFNDKYLVKLYLAVTDKKISFRKFKEIVLRLCLKTDE